MWSSANERKALVSRDHAPSSWRQNTDAANYSRERERGGGVNRDKMHSTKCSKRCARTKIERREEGGLEKEKERERGGAIQENMLIICWFKFGTCGLQDCVNESNNTAAAALQIQRADDKECHKKTKHQEREKRRKMLASSYSPQSNRHQLYNIIWNQ